MKESDERVWLTAYYDNDSRECVRAILPPEGTAAEADFVIEATGIRPPARVIDMGCRAGCHALEIARRGLVGQRTAYWAREAIDLSS